MARMALLCAAMTAAAALCVAAPAQAAFRFDRTDVSLSLGTNQRLTDVAVGDLDGAKGPDIVVSARGDNRVYVMRNQRDGSFAGPVGYSACAPLTGAPMQIVTGQLNVAQDQRLDVAVACGVLTVLRGNGAGALGVPLPTALASRGSLATAELTGGGGPELLTGAPTANAAADLLCFAVQPFELADIRCGNPGGVEDPPPLASTMQGPIAGTQTPIAANFSDPLGRRFDEVVGVNPLNTREVSVYGREPGSNFTSWSSTMRATSADRAYFLDVGDIEGDGDRDLLAGHLQGGLDVFVWGRSGILPGAVPKTTQTIGSATTDGRLADFDGDGALDVVVAGLQGRLAVHRGRGDGTFAPRQAVAVPAAAGAVLAVADLGGDRKPDVVLGTSQGSASRSDQVTVLINRTPTAPPAGTPVLRPARGITGLRTRFRVSRRQKALRLAKAINPPAAATRQTLTARPGRSKRRVVIGSGRTTVPTGTRRTVVLRLNRRGRKLLRKRGKMTARLVLVARGPTGLRDTIRKRVRLTAKPARR